MSLWYVAGFLGLSVVVPSSIFLLGKWSMKRELRSNILKLEEMKKESNEEISALIDIHFEELKKLDKSLFNKVDKEK